MIEKLTIKYYGNTEFAKEPVQASEDAAGHDLYAVEARTLFLHSRTSITLELKMAVFPRSGLLRDHFISCDAGVIDADFRGTVAVLLLNHSNKHYTIRTGDRIVQIVFMNKFHFKFEGVSDPALLGKTKRNVGGFGSKGMVEILSPPKRIFLQKLFPHSEEVCVIQDDD